MAEKRKPNLKEKLVRKFNLLTGNPSPVAKAVGIEQGKSVDNIAKRTRKLSQDMFIKHSKKNDGMARDKFIQRAKEIEKAKKKKLAKKKAKKLKTK